MENNWVSIHTVVQEYQAEMIKGMLAENDIDCVIVNKKDSTFSARSKYLLIWKMPLLLNNSSWI